MNGADALAPTREALRDSADVVHAGRLMEGLRVELDVGPHTRHYKLRTLLEGGNNAVYVPRVMRVDAHGVDVDAEIAIHDARQRARSGAAGSLSNESVAVLVYDALTDNVPIAEAVDIAGAVLDSRAITGEHLCSLLGARGKGGNRLADLRRLFSRFCSADVAALLCDLLAPSFRDADAHVAQAFARKRLRRAGAAPEPPAPPAWMDDVVVRMQLWATGRADAGKIEEYWREVAQTRKVSDVGVAPATFARLVLSVGGGKSGTVRLGVVLERFEHSLADVQDCPSLVRRMFVESDGESALVDLYARAATHVRCIDTKPANVVVRLPRPMRELRRGPREGAEEHRARMERLRPRLALIDVDPSFCGDPKRLAGRAGRVAGESAVEDLDDALAAFGSDPSSRSPLLAAAMSLVVHCAVSALACPYGLPYVRVARVLLARWDAVAALAELDERDDERHAMVPGKGGERVVEQLRHYTRAGSLDDGVDSDDVMARVRALLEARLAEAATNALALCSALGSTARGASSRPESSLVDPVLYEFTALALHAHPEHAGAVEGAATLGELQRLVEGLARDVTAPLKCHRKPSGVCDAHRALPALLDRPLLAHRPVRTRVHAVAAAAVAAADASDARPARPARPSGASGGALDASAVATVLAFLARDEFGDETASSVARAVLDDAADWSEMGLQYLAFTGGLVGALRKLDVSRKVAARIAERLGTHVRSEDLARTYERAARELEPTVVE